MQEMDNVRVTVEKETYSRDGVHKGMYGWICYSKCVKGYWLVNFPQCGEKDDIAEISIKEEDLEVVRILDARVNEQIRAQFEKEADQTKSFAEMPDDLWPGVKFCVSDIRQSQEWRWKAGRILA